MLHEAGCGAEVVVPVEWVDVGALDEESLQLKKILKNQTYTYKHRCIFRQTDRVIKLFFIVL